MIVSNIIGGLGNQMFQYSLGFSLAKKLNTSLFLDISSFKNPNIYAKRQYELKIFEIDNLFIKSNNLINLVNSIFHLKVNPYLCKSVREVATKYNSSILKKSGRLYLDGYWQSYKYFSDYEQDIANIYKFRAPLSTQTLKKAQEINKNNSISIHVRRGDYVADTSTNKHHGTCSQSYYQRSIEYISKKVKNPTFYIFSDDPDWVKKNITIKQKTVYITHNKTNDSWQDMYLMSKCKHNIIANSSFSWWGAWLNSNINKIIIAPRKWFRDTSIDTRDLIPPDWIRL